MAKQNSLLEEIMEKENVSIVDMKTGERIKKTPAETEIKPEDKTEDKPKDEPEDKPKDETDEKKQISEKITKDKKTPEPPGKKDDKEKDTPPEKKDATSDPEPGSDILEEKSSDFITKINTEFGIEVKTVDDVVEKFKEIVKVTDVVKELEGKLQELTVQNKELEDLYDPKEIFVSDNEYKRQQLLRQYPDYDPSVITKIMNTDIEKISPLDVIKLGMLLVDGDIYKNDSDVKEVIADKYTIDINESFNEIEDTLTKNKILKDAKQTKKLFKDLKEGSDDNKSFDILAKRDTKRKEKEENYRKLKDNWKPIIEKISQEIKDITSTGKDEAGENYSFVFKIDNDFKSGIKGKSEMLAEKFAKEGILSDEKGIAFIKADLVDYYNRVNFDKIIQAAISFGKTKQSEQIIKNKDNPKPLKKETDASPSLDKEEEKQQRITNRALKVLS